MKIYKKALCVVAIVFATSLLPVSKLNAQENSTSDTITVYKVEKGDTISEIAEKFGITTNTVLLANDLTKDSKIKIGQKLVILPVSGVQYTVKPGDAVESIARRFKTDKQEIIDHNNLDSKALIKIGDVLIIPGALGQVVSNNIKKVSDTVVGIVFIRSS